jgi:hypothetical protein
MARPAAIGRADAEDDVPFASEQLDCVDLLV